MTDQTEPKLQVNDWAWHIDGYLVQIAEVQDDGYGVYLGGYTLYSEFVYFHQIQKTVAVHPIEHHKCKDCENAYALYQCYPEEKYYIHPCVKLSLLPNIYTDAEARMRKINEDDEPPPNCYCFAPKLSPDEKESNEKDM